MKSEFVEETNMEDNKSMTVMDYLVGCMSYISFCAIKLQFIDLLDK